jgi:hypothetical protein
VERVEDEVPNVASDFAISKLPFYTSERPVDSNFAARPGMCQDIENSEDVRKEAVVMVFDTDPSCRTHSKEVSPEHRQPSQV